MSKKIIALIAVLVLMLTMAPAAFAAAPASNATYGRGYGFCGGNSYAGQCYSLMRDSDGNIVDKDVFEKNLDAAIEEGTISAEDREALIEMYDYCAENGGYMGGGCGMGRRWAA